MGLGFRRGSYKCLCRKGFYFPDIVSQHKFFNGSLLEEEYEKLMLVSRMADGGWRMGGAASSGRRKSLILIKYVLGQELHVQQQQRVRVPAVRRGL